jgi:hypothetical protein
MDVWHRFLRILVIDRSLLSESVQTFEQAPSARPATRPVRGLSGSTIAGARRR